jgi:hypothetical protein
MIVVRLQGGLGNQMFQYAFGLRLATELNVPLFFDIAHFSDPSIPNETPRSFELGQWNTHIKFLTDEQRKHWKALQEETLLRKLSRKILNRRTFIRVTDLNADDIIVMLNTGITCPIELKGYFQNEKYFTPVEELVRSHFTPANLPSFAPKAHCLVSVHVRRGDYVQSKTAMQWHGVCPPEYYFEAMSRMRNEHYRPQFVVFSDDPEWCMATFGQRHDISYHITPQGEGSYADIWRMSQCHHHIIANSSYSWWGAWLNPSPGKTVMAPARWLAEQTTPLNQYVPAAWIQI